MMGNIPACRTALFLGTAFAAVSAATAHAEPADFNIPAQPLPSALRAFGVQSGQPIVFSAETTGQGLSPGVVGRLEPRDALERIIIGKPLSYVSRAGGFVVVPATRRATLASAAQPIEPAQAPLLPPEPVAAPADEPEQIVVTGSRIVRPSGFDTPTPVTVIGAERIEELGITTIGDALNQLPAFRGTNQPQTANLFANNIGARFADLRGLGPQRTLVLVNGRRFTPSTALNTVDLNLIPTSLIARTEVVTGGASAAYGSDAVAGVVNIILDNRLEGLRGNVQYGISDRGDDADFLVSVAGGTEFMGGRGHIVVGAEYNDNRGTGDCYSRPYCATNQGTVTNPTPGVNGLPAILMLGDLNGAAVTPGGVINGPAVLQGIQFDDAGNPIPFERGQFWSPNALFMIGGSGGDTFYAYTGIKIKPPVERYALYGQLDFEISDSLELFAELSYGEVEGNSVSAQSRDQALQIRIDNPFIPAPIRDLMVANNLTAFTLGREGLDLGRAFNRTNTATLRAALGLNGDLAPGFTWNAYYQYGETDYRQRTFHTQDRVRFGQAVDAVTGPSGMPVCRINADANPDNDNPACVPLNLFGQNQSPQAAIDYSYGNAWQDTTFTQHVAAANVQVTPFSTWAGPVAIASGVEFRRDEAVGDADPVSQRLGFATGNATKINGESEVIEGYVEAAVPLARDVAWARNLELNGAVRHTRYEYSGPTSENQFSATTWKVGAIYQPIEQVLLRGTLSRDIRAPNVSELYALPSSTQTVLRDPVAGTNLSTVTIVAANPSLRPEIADTWTAGITFQPDWGFLDGLRISVDYFDIDVQDAITRPGTQTVLDRCIAGAEEFCAFVVRDPGTNVVTQITNPLFNLARLQTRGVDIEALYQTSLGNGRLVVRGLATYVDDLITTDSAGSIDRAGQSGYPAGQTPGVPHWLGDATVTYSDGPFSTTLQVRHIDSGYHDVTRIGPDDPRYDPFLPNSTNRNRLPSRTYFNLAAHYDIHRSGRQLVQLFLGVNNLLDSDPPAIHSNNYGSNTVYFDPIGRSYRVAVRFRY
jgi:outer membrane receptor protein involved in Fe transport